VAAAILAALEAPFPVDEHALDVGASVGVALYPAHGADSSALLRAADVAMYAAKHGRENLAVYDASLDGHSPARLGLMTDLRRALADGALQVHYQPLARLRDGRVTGAEALLRWTHPERGPIPPDVFIPLAEHSGLMELLTDWVLDEALRQCRAWEQEGRTLVVQVNLSMRSVQDARLPDRVADLLRRHEVPPARLMLKITDVGESPRAIALAGGPEALDAPGLGLRALVDPGPLLPPGTPTAQVIELLAREPARAPLPSTRTGSPSPW